MFLSTFISVFLLCCAVNSDEIVETTTSIAEDDIDRHPNVHLIPETCGSINRKSLAGNTTTLHDFPWLAYIYFKNSSVLFPKWQCTATIINSRYVITTGSCIPHDKEKVGVRIGDFDITHHTDCKRLVCESQFYDIEVDKIIIHQNFARLPQLQNNIALIRFKEKIDFNSNNILPICLPVSKKLRKISLDSKIATVIAWNQINGIIDTSVILKDNILVKTNEECRRLIYNSTASNSKTTSKEICAGGDQNDKCIGDVGAPLMLEGVYKGENRYIQYGILIRQSTDCKSQPGVYTNVAKYMKWILDNLTE